MRTPVSLQGRLALALGVGLTMLWLATAWATASLLRHKMNEVFDSTLEETAQRILPLVVVDIISREEQGISRRIATLREHEEFFTYIVRDKQGRVLLRSHAAEDADFPTFEGLGFRQTATHRLYYDAALQGSITIAVAEPLSHRAEVAREVAVGLALPLIIAIPFGLFGVFWIVRRSLRPVRQFSTALANRGARNLSAVVDGSLPKEIKPVAEAVNALLERLGRALKAERSFTSNAAHELRTPVAAALAQTQRLMAETSDSNAAPRAAEIEVALKRLTRLSEKLMQLARAEGGRLRRDTASDLRPVLDMVLADFNGMAGPARIQSTLSTDPVLSDLDPDAFAIVVRNLIENALRHGNGGTPVQVALTGDTLRVVNDGPPLPAQTLARLTARFERGQSASDGSGLGLSIVKAIADGAQATLELHSPAQGQTDGFEAVFQLPGCVETG
ncbi:ATP-binding protein [Sedimentitalea nanhaiensis]|uniref:histidine kinase n=1 Tax=Sedimentitalea nanhaiensis TaxID=999627 RepID=A0A1I7EAW1_9RHOB|nr:ATP-binding protein [Sedimentitalea nanhaiensis]SFU21059.1 two-component system, OmpR family, sensor kinase [Sedimentitalea nanhaiensis]